MPSATETRIIKVTANVAGNADIKAFSDAMSSMNKNVKSLAGGFGFLSQVTGAFLGYLGVHELINFSDEMQSLTNRIAAFNNTGTSTADIMKGLLTTAQETNSPINLVAENYAKLGVTLDGTGASAGVMNDIVKTLQNSLRLSGATANQAQGFILQLSEAFATGELRGRQLRSVMIDNAVVAKLLQKEFGANIFKEASQGAITAAKFLSVLHKNMADINDKAKELTPTIGQSLTKVLNELEVQVFALNERFKVSATVADVLGAAIQHLDSIVAAIALTTLPILISALQKFITAGIAFALENPYTAAFLAAGYAVIYFTDQLGGVAKATVYVQDIFRQLSADIFELDASIKKFFNAATLFGLTKSIKESEDSAAALTQKIQDSAAELEALGKSADGAKTSLAGTVTEWNKLHFPKKEEDDFHKLLGALNKELLNGSISIETYQSRLDEFNIKKLNIEMRNGRIDIEGFNLKLQEINIGKVNRLFNEGVVSVADYNHALSAFNLAKLNEELYVGKKTIADYNVEFAKLADKFSPGGAFRAGLQGYINSIGTTTQQVAKVIEGAFTKLEDVFISFIKTGKANFAEFTQAILDDLTRVIIRASIIQPLAQGLLNFGSIGPKTTTTTTDVGSGSTLQSAKGSAFDWGGVRKFAGGGIVNGATAFSYGSNKGIMGEAGPEAILPLGRTRTGDLGVTASVTPVTINITNNSTSEIQTKESTGPNGEKTIEVLIQNKVKSGLANGTFDKAMKANYGIGRKGA